MSLAQEEVDRLLSEKPRQTRHPEDQLDPSDDESVSSNNQKPDDDGSYDTKNAMIPNTNTYHVPSTVYAANTGPKGVIADAQAYERAKKRSFRKTLMSAAGWGDKGESTLHGRTESTLTQPALEESDDEQFMHQWREARMQELQQQPNPGAHTSTAGKRRYGTVETVNANGYLDAVEKAPRGTVIVVCIHDPESPESSIVEDCLTTIARQQPTVRFIKLHYEIADMEHVEAPAILAYKDGDVFATIINIPRQLPNGRDCSASSLRDVLMRYRIF